MKKTSPNTVTQVNLETSNSNKRKRLAHDDSTIEDAPSGKKLKPRLLKPAQLRNELKTYLESYKKELITFKQFKQECQALWATGNAGQPNTIEFMLLFLPDSSRCPPVLAEVFKRNEFFYWILDEVEPCTDVSSAATIHLICKLINYTSNEAHLDALLKRSKINAFVFKHCVPELITRVIECPELQIKCLTLVKRYFSSEQVEELKTKPLFTRTINDIDYGLTLLDVLLVSDIEAIPDFWAEGFRSYAPQKFNYNLFSEVYYDCDRQGSVKKFGPHPLKAQSVYKQIVSTEALSEMLVFTGQKNPVLIFINNKAIDKDLLAQLLKKANLVPDLPTLMACIRTGNRLNVLNRTESAQFVEKIIYIVSTFDLLLTSPADPSFLKYFENRILPSPKLKLHPQVALKVGLLQPVPTVADEILFYCAELINLQRNDKYRTQIETLIHHLQTKQGEHSNLWRTLLNAYLTQFLWQDDKPGHSCVNATKFLSGGLVKFVPAVSTDEKQQFIINYISFASNMISQWRHWCPEHTPQFLANRCAIFIATLMNTMPEQLSIPQESYYYLASLLLVLIGLVDIKDEENKKNLTSMINSFLSYYNRPANQREFNAQLLVQLMALVAGTPLKLNQELIILISTIEPTWICHIPSELKRNDKAHNVLSVLLRHLLSKEPEIAEQSMHSISYLLHQLMDKKEVLLPLDFLNEVANWKHNLQNKATLSPAAQDLLERIYDQCIHKVQGTAQEKIFEEIRTALLLKFDVDPTKDTQAIHTRENHEFADKIYKAWFDFWDSADPAEKDNILIQAKKTFFDYLSTEKAKKVTLFTNSADLGQATDYILYIHGQGGPNMQKMKKIADSIQSYEKVKHYLNDLNLKCSKVITPEMSPLERQRISDSIKLNNMIIMAVYYATSAQAPAPFALRHATEVLEILFSELLDQVQHPSCDQGPFIRILIALEPVAEYKFPYLTRRTIQFYIKEYINNYYDQLSAEERNQFIHTIYEKVDERDTLDKVDYIPEAALAFLAKQFLENNAGRIGFITPKEIEGLFFIERPQVYHPEIVAALNQFHQESKNKALLSSGYNRNRLFMPYTEGGTNSMAVNAPTEDPQTDLEGSADKGETLQYLNHSCYLHWQKGIGGIPLKRSTTFYM